MSDQAETETMEHPDDRAERIESEAYGQAHAREFVAVHQEEMLRMISLWPDDEASALLDQLREKFWARLWVPSAPSP
jgi:hypothetical protein